MNFIKLAEQVLDQREKDGIRGLDRELSRYRCHIVNAPFATKDVTKIGSPDIRESSITITQRYAHLGEDALKRAVRETNEAAAVVQSVPVVAPVQIVETPKPVGLFARIAKNATEALRHCMYSARLSA